jgi:hypothetical protein
MNDEEENQDGAGSPISSHQYNFVEICKSIAVIHPYLSLISLELPTHQQSA